VTKDKCAGKFIPALHIGSELKRARKTVERGKPERLLWSDEARAAPCSLRCLCCRLPPPRRCLKRRPARPRSEESRPDAMSVVETNLEIGHAKWLFGAMR
jgi:hypothetical protein